MLRTSSTKNRVSTSSTLTGRWQPRSCSDPIRDLVLTQTTLLPAANLSRLADDDVLRRRRAGVDDANLTSYSF
jgi:hypothetical protein